MIRMNRVMLVGNLTRDPVIRKTSKGMSVADLGLAVNDGYGGKDGKGEENACFVDVIAWDKQAETCGEYLRKGSPILVEGRLQYSQWKDKEGQSRNKIKVSADRVQFMGRPGGGGKDGGRKTEAREGGERRSRRFRDEEYSD